MTEIDKDFYCSAEYFDNGQCFIYEGCLHNLIYRGDCKGYLGCKNLHRKHPTPEQFKEEYGEEWTGAVYSHCCDSNNGDYSDCTSEKCKYFGWGDGEEYGCLVEPITVCASTPFGKPDDDWRPE
jgi:hypothetical protein